MTSTDHTAFSLAGTTQGVSTVYNEVFFSNSQRTSYSKRQINLFTASLVPSRNEGESQAPRLKSVILSAQEAEAKGLEIQGLTELLTWFKSNLGNLPRPCLKIINK